MRGQPARPRRQHRPFLGPFHAVAVGCFRLALDPPHRFGMRFSQRNPLPSVVDAPTPPESAPALPYVPGPLHRLPGVPAGGASPEFISCCSYSTVS